MAGSAPLQRGTAKPWDGAVPQGLNSPSYGFGEKHWRSWVGLCRKQSPKGSKAPWAAREGAGGLGLG